MICLHKGNILFDLTLTHPVALTLTIEDLIVNDEIILPLTINYLNVVTSKELKSFHDSRMPKTVEVVAVGINFKQEVFLYSKVEQNCIKTQVHNKSSLLINESNSTPEFIFNLNLNQYKELDLTISQIIEKLCSQTAYIDKPFNGYIASIEDLANKDFSKVTPFIKEPSNVVIHLLKDLKSV